MQHSRFSLSALLLISALVGVSAYTVVLNRELRRTKKELRVTTQALHATQAKIGTISVRDKSLPAALALPSWSNTVWDFRLYLPPDQQYVVKYAVGDVPKSGTPPDGTPFDPSLTNARSPDGYSDFTVSLEKTAVGLWAITAAFTETNSVSMGIDPAPPWLGQSFPGSRLMVAGRRQTKSATPDGRLVLVRRNHPSRKDFDAPLVPEKSNQGLIVWIEPSP